MKPRNVPFRFGTFTEDRVTIFIPDGAMTPPKPNATYPAELYGTDVALVIKIKDDENTILATDLGLRDAIAAGNQVWLYHLDTRLHYVMPMARLKFDPPE